VESETLAGLSERLSPLGALEADRATVPAKLFRLVNVIVEEPEDPAFRVREEGFAAMLKSPELTELTVTATVV
jgi:hypothetical protein